MKQPIQLTNASSFARILRSRSRRRGGFLVSALALASFAFSPAAQAVDPPPDGGYPNQNTAEGDSALFSLTSGTGNTAIGYQALYQNTTGFNNTAIGASALSANTTGYLNTACGFSALLSNTTGGANTAYGDFALSSNTSGNGNTATGLDALLYNTTGSTNTATGNGALNNNTTGLSNTATGWASLAANTSGTNNTAEGFLSLSLNTTGADNTAAGFQALHSNTVGVRNTASGLSALSNNTTGSQNTAEGANALFRSKTGSANVAIGYNALFNNKSGGSNTVVGAAAGSNLTTGSNNIEIANMGVAAEANTIRIGTPGTQTATYVAGISGMTVAGGVGVIVDASGHLGTVVSSDRFKDAIEPMDKASEAILALKPVTFRYRHELDPVGIPQFGLVAEQVEKVNPDLVARDEQGKAYTVRYEAVNAMLLNEFLKEHQKVEEQEAMISQLKSTAAQQQKEIQTLSAQIQKVSDQLVVNKSAPQLVTNQ